MTAWNVYFLNLAILKMSHLSIDSFETAAFSLGAQQYWCKVKQNLTKIRWIMG